MPQLTITVGRRLFDFDNWNDWIANAHARFQASGVPPHEIICIDKRGVVCTSGREFRLADKAEAYPVVAYWIVPEE